MPFDRSKEPPFVGTDNATFGNNCRSITPGSADQVSPAGRYYKYFVAAVEGDVTFTPYEGQDGETYTMTVSAGDILPGRIRRVTAATASLIGWFD